MKPAAVFALGLGPGLLLAAVPGPRLPKAVASADEARALVACIDAADALDARERATHERARAREAALELGTPLLDVETCLDDDCARRLPGQIAERRARSLRALEALRARALETKGQHEAH